MSPPSIGCFFHVKTSAYNLNSCAQLGLLDPTVAMAKKEAKTTLLEDINGLGEDKEAGCWGENDRFFFMGDVNTYRTD